MSGTDPGGEIAVLVTPLCESGFVKRFVFFFHDDFWPVFLVFLCIMVVLSNILYLHFSLHMSLTLTCPLARVPVNVCTHCNLYFRFFTDYLCFVVILFVFGSCLRCVCVVFVLYLFLFP